jgi:hypothetical protein
MFRLALLRAVSHSREFAEDILVGDRPAHARDWNRKEEQQEHLVTDRHVENSIACRAKNQPSHS